MSDFDLFNQALNEYKKTEKSRDSDSERSDSEDSENSETNEDEQISSCPHSNVTVEKGVIESSQKGVLAGFLCVLLICVWQW